MIRFIQIGDQILDGADDFAWFDTVRDMFIGVGDCYVWETWQEFEADLHAYPHPNPTFTLNRFKVLFPEGRSK